MTVVSDLTVTRLSEALSEFKLDVIVSGSIGAVEAPRFLRALRRLGATVQPWLTHSGANFTTPMALSWAAANPVRTTFEGNASHIALGDACVIAPASAQMIARIANGMTDTPTAALVASYLGQGKPVFLLPNMHDSLLHSPMVEDNLSHIAKWVRILRPRAEEGKAKFPAPDVLADQVAHFLNRHRRGSARILVTMGPTRGYIDDVRYISNYSSGKLGSLVCEELYRLGFDTDVVSGPAPSQPRTFSQKTMVQTHHEMDEAIGAAIERGCQSGVFSAAVLDFEPTEKLEGKTSSKQPNWTVAMRPTAKLLAKHGPALKWRAAFKLETDLDADSAHEIAAKYIRDHKLDLLVANRLSDVSETRHKGWIFEGRQGSTEPTCLVLSSKEAVAMCVASHVDRDVERELEPL